MTRPHPSEARYRRILATKREDETLRALAKRHGIKLRTLYWWHQRLRRQARDRPPAERDGKRARRAERTKEEEQPRLLPVTLAPQGGALASILAPSFEVALQQSGHILRVPATFDAEALSRLVTILEGRVR